MLVNGRARLADIMLTSAHKNIQLKREFWRGFMYGAGIEMVLAFIIIYLLRWG